MAKKSKSKSKSNARSWAPIGLWISGVALLAGVILLVVKVLAYIGMFSLPDPTYVNWSLAIALGLVLIGPAIYTLLDPRRVREFVTGRQARHGSNAILMLVSFVLILVVVNAIVFIRPPLPSDWTEDKQNTLAPETINTLEALPASVRALGFYSGNSSSSNTEELFTNFKVNSNGKFDYEIIDPIQNPGMAQQYNVTRDGTVVLILDERQEMLSYVSEQEMTNALVRLMNPGQRTVYFLIGHGEYEVSGSSERSYSRASSVLEAKNYTVKSLNLAAQNLVPEDALAIIIAGPTEPLTSNEIDLLGGYLAGGGSIVVLLEPNFTTATAPDPLIDFLATSWGVGVNNDVIIDTYSDQYIYAFADLNSYSSHPITEKLQSIISYYPTTRSLSVLEAPQNTSVTTLVQTISRSWGETDFVGLQNQQLAFDAGTDTPGPMTIAVAVENAATQGRVVVIGDSDFASDTFFDEYANGDLLINSIDWAAEQENMINLTSKQPTARQLGFIPNYTMLFLAFAFVCLIPGLVAAGGVASWLVRRSRG